ncbi:hypothetical protein [Paenibacillus motobuensis]|uniref:CARDB domain-containing protein n=1 Tax=Paenibacillus motobuensis TaxID=295324 RepID=A0ABP3I234_9BACL
MKRLGIIFVVVVLLLTIVPESNIYSNNEDKTLNELIESLKTLTPEKVRLKANEEMKELYGKDNYYPNSTKNGSFNASLVQEQIDEGIKNPKSFKGFDMVYGTSHGTLITHKGKKMYRYSGYNVEGDEVSTRGFPWDAGWSGRQLHNLPMIKNPWLNKKVIGGIFDHFPDNFKGGIPNKLKEYLPTGDFEEQIIIALNAEYAGVPYSEFMYQNKNKEYASLPVYKKDGAPNGGWINYVHVIQPPTYLSQGFGRVYMSSTYKDIPIAPFILSPGSDISAEFEDLPSGAVAGDEVTVSIIVRSTFPSKVTPNYSLEVINKNEGRTLTMEKDNLQFGGAITSATGSLEIEKKNKRRLAVSFTMPESDVRIKFKINADGKAPEEKQLYNNVLDSDPLAVKLVTPQPLPYDMLSKKVRLELPSNTATLSLPDLPDATWTGPATGVLNISSRTPDLLRDFKFYNNEVSAYSETVTVSPYVTYTIKREDFKVKDKDNKDIWDDPVHRKWLNLPNPDEPLTRTGEIYYSGSVSRPYKYTYYYEVCKEEGEEQKCTTESKTEKGVATAQFDSDSVFKPYDMYVYNGMKVLPEQKFDKLIKNNTDNSRSKTMLWENDPIPFDVIRWMHHQDEKGKKDPWEQVPGQYPRKFVQQESAVINYSITSEMDSEYAQAREAAAKRRNVKSQYDKAVFATDSDLQKYDYPIKSGYYFNPAGSYTFTVKTVVFKDKDPGGKVTDDHRDLVNALIDSFRYETDLMFINNKKKPVNIREEDLTPKGGGFNKKTGVLSLKNNKSVNGIELLKVIDRSVKGEESRFEQNVDQIKSTEKRGGDSHKFWKMMMEGYSDSRTEGSNAKYNYREYVKEGQYIYKITETSKITIQVNPENIPLYTHANMPNGNYSIKVWFDDTKLTGMKHMYSKLNLLKGIADMDSINVTVVGSMFDDLNN